MAHDKRGNKLHKGDIVAITCEVEGVDEDDDIILNCALMPTQGRSPDGKKQILIVSSRQVELLSRKDFRKTDPNLDVDSVLIQNKKGDSDPCGNLSTIIKKSNESID